MGSYDFVTADKFGKMVGPFLALYLGIWLIFDSFWTRFDSSAKNRSGNPDCIRAVAAARHLQEN